MLAFCNFGSAVGKQRAYVKFCVFEMAPSLAGAHDGDQHALAVRIAGLLCRHTPRAASASDEIIAAASRRLRASPTVAQQSSQSERVRMLNLAHPFVNI